MYACFDKRRKTPPLHHSLCNIRSSSGKAINVKLSVRDCNKDSISVPKIVPLANSLMVPKNFLRLILPWKDLSFQQQRQLPSFLRGNHVVKREDSASLFSLYLIMWCDVMWWGAHLFASSRWDFLALVNVWDKIYLFERLDNKKVAPVGVIEFGVRVLRKLPYVKGCLAMCGTVQLINFRFEICPTSGGWK